MDVIFKEIEIKGSKGDIKLKALFDRKLAEPIQFSTVNKEDISIVAQYRTAINFYMDRLSFSDEFFV